MSRETDNEMRQIQQGLEAFLQQELQEMEAEGRQRAQEPQLFTIEEEEETEEGLEVIGSTSSRKKTPAKKRVREDYYIEDWDSPDLKPKSQSRRSQYGNEAPRGRRPQYEDEAPRGRRSQYEDEAPRGRRSQYEDEAPRGRRTQYEDEAPRGRRTQSQKNAVRGRAREEYYEEPPKSAKGRKSSRTEAMDPPKKRRKKKPFSGLKKLLIAALVLFALIGGGLHVLVGNVYNKMNFEPIDSVAELPMEEDGVINVLLIGNDSRQNGEDGRSDAMILLSVSSKTKTIYMTSLLRDMYVDIPGREGNRLNAAYSFGGAELLMETVEKNLDIPVNRYVLVNFEAFANLVDAVGGVDLELTTEEIEYVNGYLVEYNMLTNRPQGTDNMDTTKPGMVHLNGPQALAYCRNRYIGTDFGRTERQRKVLTAVIKKMPTAVGTNYQELIDGLMPNLTTNLTQSECYRLSLMAGKLLTYDIISDNIPQPGTYQNATIRKMAVLEVDFEANIKYLKEKIYGETVE